MNAEATISRTRGFRKAAPTGWWHIGFIVLLVIAFATRHPALISAYLLFGSALVLAHIHMLQRLASHQVMMAALLVLTLAFILPINIFRSQTILYHFTVSLLSLLAALILTQNRVAYLRASKIALVAAQMTVLAFLFVNGISDYPLEDMIPNSSSNVVTSFLIALQINYSISNFLLYRRSSLLTATVSLCICLVGYGRGSILAAAAITTVAMLVASYQGSGRHQIIGGTLLVTIMAIAIISFASEISEFIMNRTKIGSGLIDMARLEAIQGYLSQINGLTALTGAPYTGTVIETKYNGNPHNSFIRAHNIFGLPYFLFIIFMPFYYTIRQKSFIIKLFLLIMLLILFFRAFTEPLFFPTPFDFIFYSIFLGLTQDKRL